MENLEYENLKRGLRIVDEDGHHGIVTECSDIHNVHINFDGKGIAFGNEPECGGGGLYCFDKDCEDYDGGFSKENNKIEVKNGEDIFIAYIKFLENEEGGESSRVYINGYSNSEVCAKMNLVMNAEKLISRLKAFVEENKDLFD